MNIFLVYFCVVNIHMFFHFMVFEVWKMSFEPKTEIEYLMG